MLEDWGQLGCYGWCTDASVGCSRRQVDYREERVDIQIDGAFTGGTAYAALFDMSEVRTAG